MKRTAIRQLERGAVPSIVSHYIGEVSMIDTFDDVLDNNTATPDY
jgi:hypothetical protein